MYSDTGNEKKLLTRMKIFHLTISYDGSNYCGWQKQSLSQEKEQNSICAIIERAVEKATQCKHFSILGSGRTDAGVHARAQSAQLICETNLDTTILFRAINHFLPKDIRIQSIIEKDKNFHVQKNVHSKYYRYSILHNTKKEEATTWPFLFPWTWYITKELHYPAIEKALSYLEGTHDFICFQNAGTPLSSTVRTILEAKLILYPLREEPMDSLPWMPTKNSGLELLEIRILGTGFLKQMVRNIVGTLVEVGRRKYAPEKIQEMIRGKNRQFAGPTAPPQGLFLDHVTYKTQK